MADWKDPAARFLFVYGPTPADTDSLPELLGFCHFRFTLQGELLEAMEGEPVLLVADLFLVPSVQRRGLGSHIMKLLQLIAHRHGMQGVMVAAYTALTPVVAPFLQKLRNFELDAEWTPEAEEGLTAYQSMQRKAATPATATPSAASSPDSVLTQAGASPASPAMAGVDARDSAAGVALVSQFDRVSVQDTPAAEVPFWERVAAPPAAAETTEDCSVSNSDDASAEESEDAESEDDEEQADRLLDELCTFEERNGRPPTAAEVEMWKATLAEAAEDVA